MKFGICSDVYVDQPFRKVFEHAAQCGYDGVELTPSVLTADSLMITPACQQEILKNAQDNHIEIFGMHWLFAETEGLNINSSDSRIRGKTKDYFRRLIEINRNLGAKVLTLGSPQNRNINSKETVATAVKRTTDFFQSFHL